MSPALLDESDAIPEPIYFQDIECLAHGAQLRRLCIGGREVMRSVGLVIRDGFWGTHHLRQQRCVTRHEGGDWQREMAGVVQTGIAPLLEWRLKMHVQRNGLSISAEFQACEAFSTCRAGLVLLHPLAGVVGAPVAIIHSDGRREAGLFPDLISPAQPFFDIHGLEHSPTPDLTLEWRLRGDVFEMEDQRNWSDASFKTYNRPLAWPSPYVIQAGERIEQRIELYVHRQEERQS